MRPIKFRWLTLSWKWVYGDYTSIPEMQNAMIFTASEDGMHSTEEVKRETVWQFTWLLDNNWKEIYEGDILSVKMWTRTKMSVIEWVQKSPRYDYEEEYSSLNWYVKFWNFEQKSLHPDWSAFALHEWNFEVIWNIYENLELLTKNLWA